MLFGERLAKARKEKGLTQEQLASMVGVAKSTLAGYEKGNREPDLIKIKKIVKILEVNADYLIGSLESEITQEKPALLESELSKKDKEVLKLIHSLSPENRILAEQMIEALVNKK